MAALTVPAIRAAAGLPLAAALWACLAVLAANWLAGLRRAARSGRSLAQLRSRDGIVGALSVLPVPAALALGVPAETAWLLGVLWLLELRPFAAGLALLGRVFRLEAKPLAGLLVLFLALLFAAAAAMHVLEREGQPGAFGSLPAALWWAIATLTTTGYGDAVPQTALGRLLAGLVMVCGLGVFGLWTGILATGFAAESRRRDFLQAWDLVAHVSFFGGLDPACIADIARRLRRWEAPEGITVVRRGRAGDCMYFIAAGEVEVKLSPEPVRLRQGQFFGELALLGAGTRTADVATVRPSTLLILDLADFRDFMARYPELARAVELEAARRADELGMELTPRLPRAAPITPEPHARD